MLKTVKEAIKGQKEFLEASALILEDATNGALDDAIILGATATFTEAPEEPDMGAEEPESSPELEEEAEEEGGEEPAPEGELSEEEGGTPATPAEGEEDDLGDTPIDGDAEVPAGPAPGGTEDIGNARIDDEGPQEPEDIGDSKIDSATPTPAEGEGPMPLPGNDLPEPVGAQTGEPVNPDDAIATVDLDLQSNTLRDVLPVPPASAAQAVDTDSIDTHVDAGFGAGSGDTGSEPIENPGPSWASGGASNPDDIGAAPAGEEAPPVEGEGPDDLGNSNIEGGPVTEAITLGGDGAEGGGDITAAGAMEEPPAEGGDAGGGDLPPEPTDGGEENAVTAAVRDKVEESEFDDESSGNTKDDLLKKLGSITKSLEDAKKAIMDRIQ